MLGWQQLVSDFNMKIIAGLLFLFISIQIAAGEKERENLLDLLAGEWVARGVYAATQLEISDHLEKGPKSVEELAALTGTNRNSLYRLLTLLVSFGFFDETAPEIFSNNASSKLLSKTDPDSLHSLILLYGETLHQAWDEITPSIKNGVPAFELSYKQPVFQYFKEHPERGAIFQKAMGEKSKAVIQSALANYNFGQFYSICDVGGGYGQFIQAMLSKHPESFGMVFDLPEVIEKIKHLENPHFILKAGNFFEGVPEGYDAYILKSVIHDWDDQKAEQILKNCYQAMKPESQLLLIEAVLQKPYAHCMDFLMLAITGGKERTLENLKQLLLNAGFEVVNIYSTSTEFSIIECKK